ncbi:MAG TPA: response regulator [Bacteroidales bacterium]|nr:response regulator [Bacteroidales bacterium]
MDKQKLIFMVDDDQLINNLVMKRLASEGFHVESFTYGEDCLKVLNKNPDIIILDYYFISNDKKVMNGMEVFDKIKETKPETPVIMLSGQEKGEIVLELARKGINDYIIKDNDLIDNLRNAINEILKQ